MALVKCKECGQPVSSKADKCPHCGVRVPKTSGCLVVVAIFLAIGAIGGPLVALFSEPTPAQGTSEATAAENAARKKADEGVARAQLLTRALKKSMRDPDSFKLESAMVIDETNAVCIEYRARNGFGGMNVGHAAMSGDGKTIRTDEMDGFHRLWSKECKGKVGRDHASGLNLLMP